MFIAMNRFPVLRGQEDAFEAVWSGRNSYLKDVPGFITFHLLRGSSDDQTTLFASHTVWQSRADFEAWTKSEAFRMAHANAGGTRGLYAGPPKLELFEAVEAVNPVAADPA
jgi:heme-degrading monooxygenase HmoA